MSLATVEAEQPPTTNVLVDGLLHSPLEDNETTPLLGDTTAEEQESANTKVLPWRKRPSPAWLLIPAPFSALLMGASVSVELEILSQVACRAVPLESMPVMPSSSVPTAPQMTSAPSGDVNSFGRGALDAPTDGVAAFVQGALSKLDAPPIVRPYRHVLGFRIAEPADEDWAARCRKSNTVQKKTAKFFTQLMMLGGGLGAATTGYWGALSDRRGRIPLLALATVGQLCTAIGMILLVTYPEYLGEKWAFAGVAAGGLLGGDLAGVIVTQAYLSDVVGGSRAQIFSLNEALQYVGVGLGPIVGGLAYRWTGLLLIPYYSIFLFKLVWVVLLLFIVPESLSRGRQHDQRQRAKELAAESGIQLRREEDDWRRDGHSLLLQRTWRLVKKPLQLLEPLTVVLPRKMGAYQAEEDKPLLAPRRSKSDRNWSVTLIACSLALYLVVPGVTPVKIIFARGQWDWGPPETGMWITFSSAAKLVMLLGVLPILTRTFRKIPPMPPQPRPTSGEEEQQLWDREAARLKLLSDSTFDMKLARGSILVTLLAYTLMTFPHQSLARFLSCTFLIGLSAAATPALQSLALAFSSPAHAGKVLAALSVLFNIAVQLVGPPVFGGVYVATVDFWPELVFGVAALYVFLSFLPTLAVNLKDEKLEEEHIE